MSLATSSFLRTIIRAVENHLNQRLPRYKRGVVVGQASDPMKILVAPSGENGVSDLFEYPILRPYTSATVGDPGGPALDDDLLILETTPNNPVINGQLLTNPNDKPNRDGYPGIDKVSITQNDAKKLRAHAIVIDHVPPVDGDVPATARDGMLIVSTFDNSLWKRVSGTWYQVGATKWGAVVDPDGFINVWIAASVTLPTDGTGDQTAHTTPGYTPDVYNTSALGLDGGAGHAAYVKHDQKSITQTADGKLRAHAITITHSPPIDADVPGTARDGMVVVCTNDNTEWFRSSGTWHQSTGGGGGGVTMIEDVLAAGVNLPTAGVQVQVCSISVPAGTWLIMANVLAMQNVTHGTFIAEQIGGGTPSVYFDMHIEAVTSPVYQEETVYQYDADAPSAMAISRTVVLAVPDTITLWVDCQYNNGLVLANHNQTNLIAVGG